MAQATLEISLLSLLLQYPACSFPTLTNCKYLANDQAALGTGQLVKDEYFTLFEAVGALEVLLPRAICLRRPVQPG